MKIINKATIISQRRGGAALDILRFSAALFILLFHFYLEAPSKIEIINPIMSKGWLGTDFFLLLSGFIMSRAYGDNIATKKVSIGKFMAKRYLRLMPSHLVVLAGFGAIFVILKLLGQSPNNVEAFSLKGFIYQALLINAWGVNLNPVWNIPTWTLSALLICYFIFAIFGRFLRFLKNWQLVILIIAALAIGNFLAYFWAHEEFVRISLSHALIRALPLFFIGVIVEILSKNLKLSQNQFYMGLAMIIFIIIALIYINWGIWGQNLILLLLALMIAIGGASILPETKITKNIGKTSYSLFLIHTPIQVFGFRFMKLIGDKFSVDLSILWAIWLVLTILTIVLAFAFEKYIDSYLSRKFHL